MNPSRRPRACGVGGDPRRRPGVALRAAPARAGERERAVAETPWAAGARPPGCRRAGGSGSAAPAGWRSRRHSAARGAQRQPGVGRRALPRQRAHRVEQVPPDRPHPVAPVTTVRRSSTRADPWAKARCWRGADPGAVPQAGAGAHELRVDEVVASVKRSWSAGVPAEPRFHHVRGLCSPQASSWLENTRRRRSRGRGRAPREGALQVAGQARPLCASDVVRRDRRGRLAEDGARASPGVPLRRWRRPP